MCGVLWMAACSVMVAAYCVAINGGWRRHGVMPAYWPMAAWQ